MPTIKYNETEGVERIVTNDGKVSCECCTFFGLLASATSAGGNLECQMGEAVQTYYIPPPYKLKAGISYKLTIIFNSGDHLYHLGSYYQANYSPLSSFQLVWQTTYSGTTGNPWSISNNGKTIRFSLEDSENCGGSNKKIQAGTAEAILTPTNSLALDFSFNGIAELESAGYENISFYLEPAT
jgi:hypothetical protein